MINLGDENDDDDVNKDLEVEFTKCTTIAPNSVHFTTRCPLRYE